MKFVGIEESKDHGYDLRYSNKFKLDTTKGNIVTQDAWDKDKLRRRSIRLRHEDFYLDILKENFSKFNRQSEKAKLRDMA
jgi:hypothetical protein